EAAGPCAPRRRSARPGRRRAVPRDRAAGRPAGRARPRAGARAVRAARLPKTPPRSRNPARTLCSETLLTDEGDEAARDGPDHGGAFRAAHDHLQPLDPVPADGNDEPAAVRQLFVQGLWQTRRRGRDGDRIERRTLRQTLSAVADVHTDPVVAGG